MWKSLWIIALIAALLLLYRRSMVVAITRGATFVNDAAALASRMQPGDIVFMASRDIDATFIHGSYAVVSAAYMRTPFYHAFLVLPEGRVGHFVHNLYTPRLEMACETGTALQFGNLAEYIEARQRNRPVYMVFRHPTRPLVDVERKMRELCDRRFPSELQILGSILGLIYLDPTVYAHCNSYIGILLARDGYMPLAADPHREYIPVKNIQTHLPAAGFRVVKTLAIGSLESL